MEIPFRFVSYSRPHFSFSRFILGVIFWNRSPTTTNWANAAVRRERDLLDEYGL
jgi:hypothetical protein